MFWASILINIEHAKTGFTVFFGPILLTEGTLLLLVKVNSRMTYDCKNRTGFRMLLMIPYIIVIEDTGNFYESAEGGL